MANALAGVRVLDLTRILAGPYGSMLLADMGAEVIKVEPPGGEPTRNFGPPFWNGVSPYFISVNRNKRSITLDLKKDAGRDIFLKLVGVADVIFSNFRPGVLERLGLTYERCRDVKPEVVFTMLSGYGQTGPYRDLAGVDVSIQAGSGGMSITGEPGRPPVRMGIPVGDLGAGMLAATGTCAALFRRAMTGEGDVVDISLFDTQVSMLTYVAQNVIAGGADPGPIGSEHQTTVPYGAYKAQDGYVVIGGAEGKFWVPICEVLGITNLAAAHPTVKSRIDGRAAIRDGLENALARRTVAEWVDALRERGVPCSAVARISEVISDPQVADRKMVMKLDEPDPVNGHHLVLGNPIKMGSDDTILPIPQVGEANEYLYRDVLGLSHLEVTQLREHGVI